MAADLASLSTTPLRPRHHQHDNFHAGPRRRLHLFPHVLRYSKPLSCSVTALMLSCIRLAASRRCCVFSLLSNAWPSVRSRLASTSDFRTASICRTSRRYVNGLLASAEPVLAAEAWCEHAHQAPQRYKDNQSSGFNPAHVGKYRNPTTCQSLPDESKSGRAVMRWLSRRLTPKLKAGL